MFTLERTKKSDKSQARLINKNKKEDIIINPADIKKITRRYGTQLCVNTFVDLFKMGKLHKEMNE